MAATRKKTFEASAQDLDQMKSIFGGASVKQNTQVEQVSQVVQTPPSMEIPDFDEPEEKQIESVAAPIQTVVTQPAAVQISAAVSATSAPAGSPVAAAQDERVVSDTTVGIRMTKQKKREMKAYFIQKGTTLSQGVIDAYHLLKAMEAEGKIVYRDGQLERV